MERLAVGTIVTKSYLAFARVLAGSLREHHPGVPLFVLLADEVDGRFAPEAEPFRLLRLADLAIPRLPRFQFRYSRAEATSAAKPYLLSHLLELGFDSAVYLDADILVLSDLGSIFSRVGEHAVVLTPHVLTPPADEERAARELNILLSGVYNGGFIGVSGTAAARSFLAWWQDRLYDHCHEALPQGLHYDQRWLDLAPPFFEDVHVLRDPTCNVAYWNLPERDVRLHEGTVLVQGRPCLFFHFSGFDPDRPLAVTRHLPHLTVAGVGPAAALFQRYRALLEAAGHHESKTWPYAYDRFDNGVPIPGVARQIYGNLGDAAEAFGDPFRTAPPQSYFRWLHQAADDRPGSSRGVTRLWRAVYEQRVDVQRAYPDLLGADREAFLAWAARHGAREHGIPESFMVEPMDLAQYRIEFRGEVRTSESFGPGFLPELASLVERYVPTGSSFLEWGSGLSTQLLAEIVDRRGGTLVSVEQYADYAQAVLANVRSPHVVQSVIADLAGPKLSQADTGLSYSTWPLGLGRSFDFILIDGRRRVECALIAFILSAPHTVVALHDYRRARYQSVSVLFDVLEEGPHFRVMRAKAELAGLTAAARARLLRQISNVATTGA